MCMNFLRQTLQSKAEVSSYVLQALSRICLRCCSSFPSHSHAAASLLIRELRLWTQSSEETPEVAWENAVVSEQLARAGRAARRGGM